MCLVFLSGCFDGNPSFFEKWRNWRVKEGKHRFTRLGAIDLGKSANFRGTAQFEAYFEDNCWYDASYPNDHLNKLGGLGKNLANRATFAWRPSQNKGFIDIFAYGHNNDKNNHFEHYLGTVEVNEIADYQVNILGDNFTFRFNNGDFYQVKKDKWFEGYFGSRSFPYFGGNPAAPHPMNIHMYWYN